MKRFCLILIPFFFPFLVNAQNTYEIVVAIDFDGNVTSGSIDTLIAEIRKGKPVRVGWQLDFNKDGKPDLDHWVDAEFITILGGHVFNQIEEIYIQGPKAEVPQVEIYPTSSQWTALIGTNGKLLNRFIMDDPPPIYDDEGNEIIDEKLQERLLKRKEVKTWKAATFWSVMR